MGGSVSSMCAIHTNLRHVQSIQVPRAHESATLPTGTKHSTVSPHSCRLKVEAAYHSTRPPRGGLTVTTFVTMERLHFLEAQCASWEGPLIAAAYLSLIAGEASDLDSALSSIRDVFTKCALVGIRLVRLADGGYSRSLSIPNGFVASLLH